LAEFFEEKVQKEKGRKIKQERCLWHVEGMFFIRQDDRITAATKCKSPK